MVCGEGNGNPLQYPCLENPPDRGPWLLQSMGFQRIRYNLATKQQHVIRLVFHHWGNVLTISYPLSKKKDNWTLQRNVRHLYLAALIMKYSRGKHRKEKDFTKWVKEPWKTWRQWASPHEDQLGHGRRCQKDVIDNWQKVTMRMNKSVI